MRRRAGDRGPSGCRSGSPGLLQAAHSVRLLGAPDLQHDAEAGRARDAARVLGRVDLPRRAAGEAVRLRVVPVDQPDLWGERRPRAFHLETSSLEAGGGTSSTTGPAHLT